MDDSSDSCGPSPLTVLLSLMREKWDAGDKEEAARFAQLAAPYVHSRATRPAYTEPAAMSDAELAAAIASLTGLGGLHN